MNVKKIRVSLGSASVLELGSIGKFKGSPTVHIQLKWDRLIELVNIEADITAEAMNDEEAKIRFGPKGQIINKDY